jgi:hypothetical protein
MDSYDFVVNVTRVNGEANATLVSGDFATAKAKICSMLPVWARINYEEKTIRDGQVDEYTIHPYVDHMRLMGGKYGESLACFSDTSVVVYSDNTVEVS